MFVVLTLDAPAMLAPLGDAALNASCSELKTKNYLAVVGLKPLETGQKIHDRLEFHLISQGLVQGMPDLGINSLMCVPVFPETEHPSRKALRPAGPALPFPNCYYHSHNSTVLMQVTEVDNSRPNRIYLPLDELERLDVHGIEDETHAYSVRRTLKSRVYRTISCERPLSPFKDTLLSRPCFNGPETLHSATSETSWTDDSAPSSGTSTVTDGCKAVSGLIYAGSPGSSWSPYTLISITNSPPAIPSINSNDNIWLTARDSEERQRYHPPHFRPKVKVSLDLNELQGVGSLPSSTDFQQEICRVHE
ncbi:hypothetical protein K439DRAFT_476958 [Ramaria rubella]|nr:hypothetical protein K439DRAFT_476958 [Ramaria rubella]